MNSRRRLFEKALALSLATIALTALAFAALVAFGAGVGAFAGAFWWGVRVGLSLWLR